MGDIVAPFCRDYVSAIERIFLGQYVPNLIGLMSKVYNRFLDGGDLVFYNAEFVLVSCVLEMKNRVLKEEDSGVVYEKIGGGIVLNWF